MDIQEPMLCPMNVVVLVAEGGFRAGDGMEAGMGGEGVSLPSLVAAPKRSAPGIVIGVG